MTDSRIRPPFFPVLGRAAEILRSTSLPPGSLAALRVLNDQVSPEVARAVLALRDLRERAGSKFREPGAMLLTAKGLEQATDGRVAAWRAARLAEMAAGQSFWDCTAGLGADALALGDWGLDVVASDLDPLTGAVLGTNLCGRGFVADALAGPFRAGQRPGVVLFDPDRRTGDGALERGRQGGGRRRMDPGDFGPAIGDWSRVLEDCEGAVVKLPPGLEVEVLEQDPGFGAWLGRVPHRWTWVEAGGALREMTLWTGILAPAHLPQRAAVRIMGPEFPAAGQELVWAGLAIRQEPRGAWAPYAEAPDPDALTHIAEARPSARRAGAAAAACHAVHPDLAPIDDFASYHATSESGLDLGSSDFADTFRVLGQSTLDKKHMRRLLREHRIGALTIKKRGIQESSAAIAAKIGYQPSKKDRETRPGILIVASTSKGRRGYLVERLPSK